MPGRAEEAGARGRGALAPKPSFAAGPGAARSSEAG